MLGCIVDDAFVGGSSRHHPGCIFAGIDAGRKGGLRKHAGLRREWLTASFSLAHGARDFRKLASFGGSHSDGDAVGDFNFVGHVVGSL
jgi:hypothetical protein